MLRKFKWSFVFIAVLFSLSACTKGCSGSADKVVGSDSGEALFAMIPAENNVLIHLDVKKIYASDYKEQLSAAIPQEAKPYITMIDQVWIAMSYKEMAQEPNPIAILKGQFNKKVFIDLFKKNAEGLGGKLEEAEYAGKKVYKNTSIISNSFTFMDDGTVILGDTKNIRQVLDIIQKKTGGLQKNTKILDLLKRVDSGNMFWMVFDVPEKFLDQGPGINKGLALEVKKIKGLLIQMNYARKNLSIKISGQTNTEEEAKKLATMLNGTIGFFSGGISQQQPTIAKVLNGLAISNDAAMLNVAVKVDKMTLDVLMKEAQKGFVGR